MAFLPGLFTHQMLSFTQENTNLLLEDLSVFFTSGQTLPWQTRVPFDVHLSMFVGIRQGARLSI